MSLLPFLTGLFPTLLHMVRVGFCTAAHAWAQLHWAAFQGIMGACSVCHQVPIPQCLNVCVTAQDCTALSKTQPSHGLFSRQEAEPTTNMRLTWKDNAPFLATLNTNKQMECVPPLTYTPIPLCMPTAPECIHRQTTLLCCFPITQCTEIAASIPHWAPLALSDPHAKLHAAGNSAVASRNIKERTFLLNGVTQQFIECRISNIIAWHQFSVTISSNMSEAGRWWMVSGRRHLKWELVDQG